MEGIGIGSVGVIKAIEGKATCLALANPLAKIVDNLPYYDNQNSVYDSDPKMKLQVHNLIKEQMNTMEAQDYILDLPPPDLKFFVFSSVSN